MTAEKRTGGCHCGRVRYEVKVDLAAPAVTCNCSMCGKAGTMLAFVPADAFTLTSGDGELTDYTFHHHVISHLFCKTCGIKPFARGVTADGAPTVAVNVRCLDDVDLRDVKTHDFDGKSL